MIPEVCKHYAAAIKPGVEYNTECKLGISYTRFAEIGAAGWLQNLPCFRKDGRTHLCDRYEEPTKD